LFPKERKYFPTILPFCQVSMKQYT